MSAFDDIVGAGVVGTARQDPGGLAAPDGLQLAEGRAERRLLDLAAAFDLMRRAGYRAVAGSHGWPAAAPDRSPVCGNAAAGLLTQLLADDSLALLRWWLLQARRTGQRPQPATLPDLLGRVHKDPVLRRETAPLLDARGAWLCGLNPAWRALLGLTPTAPDAQAWQEGAADAREAALRAAVAADRAQARDWLEQLWAVDPARLRERWLACLAPAQPDDEDWLERKLDDRAEGVRQAAVRLLLGLPGSRLRQRALRRALACVQRKRKLLGGSVLEVMPPPVYQAEWARDGISSRPPQGAGERAHWLRQILAQAAPAELAAALEMDAAAWHKLARGGGEWSELVAAAWNEAAVNCRDRAALRLVLPELLAAPEAEPLRQCLAAVDTATADEALAAALPALNPDAAGFSVLNLVLADRAAECYPPELARALADFLERALGAPEASTYSLRQIPVAALTWLGDADAAALQLRWLAAQPRRDSLQDPLPRDLARQALLDFLERRRAIAAAFAPAADGAPA
jgi:hypothetical protein